MYLEGAVSKFVRNHFRTFEIHIPCGENTEEVFYFTAQNDIETQKWLVAFDRAISRCNTQNGVRSSGFRTEENVSTGMQRMKRRRDNEREIQRIKSILVPESPLVGSGPGDSNSSLEIIGRHRSSGTWCSSSLISSNSTKTLTPTLEHRYI